MSEVASSAFTDSLTTVPCNTRGLRQDSQLLAKTGSNLNCVCLFKPPVGLHLAELQLSGRRELKSQRPADDDKQDASPPLSDQSHSADRPLPHQSLPPTRVLEWLHTRNQRQTNDGEEDRLDAIEVSAQTWSVDQTRRATSTSKNQLHLTHCTAMARGKV